MFGLFLVAGYVAFMLIVAAIGNLAWGAAGFCAVFAFGYLRGPVSGPARPPAFWSSCPG